MQAASGGGWQREIFVIEGDRAGLEQRAFAEDVQGGAVEAKGDLLPGQLPAQPDLPACRPIVQLALATSRAHLRRVAARSAFADLGHGDRSQGFGTCGEDGEDQAHCSALAANQAGRMASHDGWS